MTGTRPGSRTLGYQPALDGIRAVAVLGVLVFHAGIERVVGGFLGVDLFFVLSGFLITTLLLRECTAPAGSRSGASTPVASAGSSPPCCSCCWRWASTCAWWLPRRRARPCGSTRVSSLFYVANWRFVFSHQSYFAGSPEPSPLRHLWSLAVEEQWYLFWPLVLRWSRCAGCRERLDVLLAFVLALAVRRSAGWPTCPGPRRPVTRLLRHRLARPRAAARRGPGHLAPPAPGPPRVRRRARARCSASWVRRHRLVLRRPSTGTAHWLYLGGFCRFVVAGLLFVDAAMAPGADAVQRLLGLAPLRGSGASPTGCTCGTGRSTCG